MSRDPENHYRERIMLFLQWRNEEKDLHGGYKTYEEHYMAKESLISPIQKKYEKYNDSLESVIEEVEKDEFDDI